MASMLLEVEGKSRGLSVCTTSTRALTQEFSCVFTQSRLCHFDIAPRILVSGLFFKFFLPQKINGKMSRIIVLKLLS